MCDFFMDFINFKNVNVVVDKDQNGVRKDPAIWGNVADLESLELKLKYKKNLNTFVPDFGWNTNTLKEAISSYSKLLCNFLFRTIK